MWEMLTTNIIHFVLKRFILILNVTLVANVWDFLWFGHLSLKMLDLEVIMDLYIVATLLSHFWWVYADFLIDKVTEKFQVRIRRHLYSGHQLIGNQILDVMVADGTLRMRLKPFL